MSGEGTPAERFAIEHAHYTEDLPFWLDLARQHGGTVLDLGAAVGRVSAHLAVHGHPVVAVDGDPPMIDQLTRTIAGVEGAAPVRAICADLRTLDLGERFGLVLLPMNTLQALLTRDDQLAVLRAAHRHVADGGEFAFDVVMADLDVLADHVGEVHDGARYRDRERELTHAARFDSVDVSDGTVRFTLLIDETCDGRTEHHERPHTVHLFEPSELWDLLGAAGFEVLAVYGSFDGAPLEPDSERQIYRCGLAA